MTVGGFIFLAIIVVVVLGVVGVIKANQVQKNKEAYLSAISRGDKAAALMLGRVYYASARDDGKLTIYDEQAIANDLATMK